MIKFNQFTLNRQLIRFKLSLLKLSLFNKKKYFSSSPIRLADQDDVIERSKKIQKEMADFLKKLKEPSDIDSKSTKQEQSITSEITKEVVQKREEVSLPFSDVVDHNIKWLATEQDKAHGAMQAFIDMWSKKLPKKSLKEIHEKYDKGLMEITEKGEKKMATLEEEFKNEVRSVDYWRQKVDIEASIFKKKSHEYEKKEKEIFEKVQEKQPNLNEENLKTRSEVLGYYQGAIALIRERKKEVKNQMESNLERPSQMIESINNDVPSSGDMED